MVFAVEGSLTYVMHFRYLVKDFSMQKGFTLKSYLIASLKIHSGEKSFISEAWNNGFARKTGINKHSRNHKENEPCICDVYNERFSLNCNLNVNFCIYAEEKPFIIEK